MPEKSQKYTARIRPLTAKAACPAPTAKVKGTIHWVSCAHCLQAEVRLYDRLWKVENPRDELAAIREAKNCDTLTNEGKMINPDSLNVLPCCYRNMLPE